MPDYEFAFLIRKRPWLKRLARVPKLYRAYRQHIPSHWHALRLALVILK